MNQHFLFGNQEGLEFATPGRIGGKGRNLALLRGHGVRVPPFVVLTVEAFEALLGARLPEIDQLAARVGEGLAAADASREIQARIESAEFAPVAARAILEAAQDLAGKEGLLAVRSSAVDEDSESHSFAGQLDSYLFQKADESILAAIRRCMASAFTERALAYRKANGLDLTKIRAAVILQEMVFGEVSGVTFTANPINGEPAQCVVNAIPGVGEGIVSGELDCDSWVLGSRGAVVREEIREKPEMIVFDREAGRGTKKVPVDETRRRQPSLGAAELKGVFEVCRRIEEDLYGGQPQDVEWCLRGGELFVVQARPIAAFSRLRKKGRHIVFDNSNVIESYSGVPTPLTYSFASASFRATFRGVFERLGMPERRLRALDSLFVNMLGYFQGRMYYNLLNWYRYFQEVPHAGDNIREFDQLIGISAENAVEAPEDGLPDRPDAGGGAWRAWQGWRMSWKILTIRWVARDFERHFYAGNAKYVNEFFRTQANPELIEIYREIFANGSPYWDGEIVNFIGAQRAFSALARMLRELGFTNVAGLQNDLIGGDGGIASMRPTREMIGIADAIRANAGWRQLILSSSDEELRERVLESPDPALAPLRGRIERFLEEYGCRCMDELKLEEPTLRENPDFLFSTLRTYVQKRPEAFETQLEHQLAARRRAEQLVYSRASLLGRLRLRWAISKVRRHVYYREELRLVRGKYWGMVRRLFRAVGRNFEREGVLKTWDDIFLLKVDEVAELVEGRSPDAGHLKELLELRRRARAEQLSRPAPSRVHSYGDVCAGNFTFRLNQMKKRVNAEGATVLKGIACGPGVIKGRAKVALNADGAKGLNGEILVTERTDPGWIPLYPSISGLVIERGSVLSHSAVVAREMGIPTVVGVAGATQVIHTGEVITVDGSEGTVEVP